MDASSQEKSERKKKENGWLELLKFAFYAAIIVIPIRMWIAEPFVVSGSSMVPTFENGQYLIIDELTYKFEEPKRGDVIVFHYPKDTSKYFIKRIIGLPGETVTINTKGVTIINKENPKGMLLTEPYISEVPANVGAQTTTLDAEEYFVMGDNRPFSSDSRAWGTLPQDDIVGRTFLRLFPLGKIDVLPGEHNY